MPPEQSPLTAGVWHKRLNFSNFATFTGSFTGALQVNFRTRRQRFPPIIEPIPRISSGENTIYNFLLDLFFENRQHREINN
ncbi:MAG: hypothetical protein DMF26_18850 [Verrucomicrobia bacterium]|nr:MAG: hypothetical protein DMF26_18850 [Verrucomicrobiota bacterium]